VATVGRIIIIDCSSSRSRSRAIVKVSLDSAIVSVVGTDSFRSSTRRYSYCLRSGSVISTSSSSIGEWGISLLQ
jgi:hypothetical protein